MKKIQKSIATSLLANENQWADGGVKNKILIKNSNNNTGFQWLSTNYT